MVTPAATGDQILYLSPTLAQSWLNSPASNNAIIIANAANIDVIDFSSRESTASSLRPQLNATYIAA